MYGQPGQVDVLTRLLDVASLRHQAIAQNIANVNTPGYHRTDVSFEDAFTRARKEGHDAVALRVEPRLVEPRGEPVRGDGNNVDIDAEMGRLEKNTLMYKVYAQILASQLASMRAAIAGH
jgi:flagellar basal-body rod protein FlgB